MPQPVSAGGLLPQEIWDRLFSDRSGLSLEDQAHLGQTCSLLHKLWHTAQPCSQPGKAPCEAWVKDAPSRLWRCSHGTFKLANTARGSWNEGVVTIELSLTARHLVDLCCIGARPPQRRCCWFAAGLRAPISAALLDDASWVDQHRVDFPTPALVRLYLYHNAACVSDEQRDALQAMLWHFPHKDLGSSARVHLGRPACARFSEVYFEPFFVLVGPDAAESRLRWGVPNKIRAPDEEDCTNGNW